MKKLMSLLLVVLMAIMPAMSLADATDVTMKALENGRAVETQLVITPGTFDGVDEDMMGIVKDLFGALSMSGYVQMDQLGFSVDLNGEPALKADLYVEDDVAYLSSNFLGQEAVRLSAEDIIAAVTMIYEANVAQMVQEGAITQEQGQQMLEEFQQQLTGMTTTMDMSALADIDFSELTFENTQAALAEVMATVQTEENPTDLPEGCDPAVLKVTFTMTVGQAKGLTAAVLEDLKASASLMKALDTMMANFGIPAMADVLSSAVDQIKADTAGDATEIPMAMYLDANGEVVYLTVTVNAGEGDQTVETTVAYMRETTEDGVQHTVVVYAVPNGDEAQAVTCYATVLDADTACIVAVVVMQGETELVSATAVTTTATAENAEQSTMDLVYSINDPASGQTVSIRVANVNTAEWTDTDVQTATQIKYYLNDSDQELLTVETASKTTDAKPAVSTANAVTFATMSQEEVEAWLGQVANTAQLELIGVLQKLPASVLQLFMGQ